MKGAATAILLILFSLRCSSQAPAVEIRSDLEALYKHYNVKGSFALFNHRANTYTLYNPDQFREPFIPASTFKICNSLIALETGVISDEDYRMAWDSVTRRVTSWNQDHTLRTAFRNSVVWYYQEIARRVGDKEMKKWLEKAQYGNADISGGVDEFWLTGGLRVTPEQQINFLRRLHAEELPFGKRAMQIVKDIMIVSDSAGTIVRAKTGWSRQGNQDIGWYVGYVETTDNVYYFANCLQTSDFEHDQFGKARIEIANAILRELGIIGE